MSSFCVKEGNDQDVYSLVGRLRQADKDELFATNGQDPDKTLVESWQASKYRRVMIYEKQVICAMGIVEFNQDIGIPWLLGSDEISSAKRQFLKGVKEGIDFASSKYRYLINFIDIRQSSAIRYFTWMGCKFEEPKPFGFENRLFTMFIKTRD
jgi:hypothetical protein